MDSLTRDDLRAAVAADVLTEQQAAQLLAIGEARLGQRAALGPEDEPFELFRGFAEIFVSVGIVLLLSGILTVASLLGGAILPVVTAGLCWIMALYFTRRRRMVLPSIVLTTGFAAGTLGGIWALLEPGLTYTPEGRGVAVLFCLLALAALGVWFRAFRVPFTMFVAGIVGAALVFVLVDAVLPFEFGFGGWEEMFDLRRGSGLAVATLLFGLIALAGGLWCDMRDPHRLGRWSSTGFWLHILAAPALVNTIALTAYNAGGTAGNLLLALALAAVALLALVIDRRSFLTAGIGYLGVLIAWVLRGDDGAMSFALLLIVLGGFLTGMGAFWANLRARIMRALPGFPGKTRLPPYAETP